MRSHRITWDAVGAWETWIVDVPNDAPDPLTPEWVDENIDRLEFQQIKSEGRDRLTNPQIHE